MLTLDNLCALPQAGRALLAAHKWITSNQAAGASAFDLVGALTGLPGVQEELPLVLESIAADNDTAHAMLHMLFVAHKFDRSESLSKALGLPPHLPAVHVEELNRLLREGLEEGKKGGAA